MGVVDSIGFRLWHFYRSADHSVREWLASVNETPILVLGNQKSGTTAIAALLAERAGLSVTWDLTMHDHTLIVEVYKGRAAFEEFVQKNRYGFSKQVIKDCTLTFLYDSLKERFPRAQFVMVMRDPRDNIRSILDRLELPGDQTKLDPARYEEMAEGWKLVVDGTWMGINSENYIDSLAARWNRAARIYLEHQEAVKLIRYEDFMQGKVEAIDSLVSRLGEDRKKEEP